MSSSTTTVRATLNLDNDVLEGLKQYAVDHSLTLGKAASLLLRRSLAMPIQTRLVNGFHAIVLPRNSPKISSEKVKRLLEP